jgi:Tfp pilus assembly protein PilO
VNKHLHRFDIIKLIAIVPFILIIIFYYLNLKPSYEHYRSLQKNGLHLQADYSNKLQKIVDEKFFQQELKKTDLRLNKIPQCLSNQIAPEALLQAILMRGAELGLLFALFAPGKEAVGRFSKILPLSIQVRGTYFQLVTFLRFLTKNNPSIRVHDFKISVIKPSANKLGEKNEEDNLDMNLSLTICRAFAKRNGHEN